MFVTLKKWKEGKRAEKLQVKIFLKDDQIIYIVKGSGQETRKGGDDWDLVDLSVLFQFSQRSTAESVKKTVFLSGDKQSEQAVGFFTSSSCLSTV